MVAVRPSAVLLVAEVVVQVVDHTGFEEDRRRPCPSSILDGQVGYDSGVRVAAALVIVSALSACERDPEEALCPDVAVGGLIVTEVRGPQTPADALNGEWVEIYNASGKSIDLEGVRVRFRRKDGSSEVSIIVRESVPAAAGQYVVLGLFLNDASRPAHVDYGFASDFTATWLAAAAVDVETCGTRIDRAVYDVLPKMGTFSFTGAMTPDTNMNDDLRLWCTNGAMVNGMYPGSPKQANPPCP